MKQFNVRLFVFLFIYIIGFQFSNAQNLSLEDAIQIGLQNQYSIKISKKKEDQAKNDNTLGNAGFLPTITGTSNLNYTISGIDQSFYRTTVLRELRWPGLCTMVKECLF